MNNQNGGATPPNGQEPTNNPYKQWPGGHGGTVGGAAGGPVDGQGVAGAPGAPGVQGAPGAPGAWQPEAGPVGPQQQPPVFASGGGGQPPSNGMPPTYPAPPQPVPPQPVPQQPMPQHTASKPSGSPILVAVVILSILGICAAVGFFLAAVVNRSFEQPVSSSALERRSSTTTRTPPPSPTTPSLREPSGGTADAEMAGLIRDVAPPHIDATLDAESCQRGTFPWDPDVTQIECLFDSDLDANNINIVALAVDRNIEDTVRNSILLEEWNSIESALGHDLVLVGTGPIDGTEVVTAIDFRSTRIAVVYSLTGTEDEVSKKLVDYGLAEYKAGAGPQGA